MTAAARRARRALLAAALVAALVPALAAAAPPATTPSAASLFAAAARAAHAAHSVRVVASYAFAGASYAFDIRLVAGVGGEGTFRENGSSAEIVRIGARLYTRADGAFWRRFADPQAAALFSGRWVESSATSGWFASVAADFDMRHLVGGLLSSHGPLVDGGKGEVAGVPVVELRDSDTGGTLAVEAHGTPYPLELRNPAGLHVRLEAWNTPVALAPLASSVPFASLPAQAPAQVPGEPVSLALPLGWAAAAPVAGLPSQVAYLATAQESVGFRANLNLVVAHLPAGESLVRAFLGPVGGPVRALGRLRPVVVDGIHGYVYRSTRDEQVEGVPLLTEAWLFDRSGTVYQFTYTAPASQTAQYGVLFAASAATIRFGASGAG